MRVIQAVKMWLAKKGLIVLAEPVDEGRKLYRVYCPKCGTWHIACLSGYPGEEHFHLPCGEIVAYTSRRSKIQGNG